KDINFINKILFFIPFILSSVFSVMAVFVYQTLFSKTPSEDFAAFNIVFPWFGMFIMISNSLASSCSIIISHEFPRERVECLYIKIRKSIKLSIYVGLSLGIIFFLLIPIIYYFYSSINLDVRLLALYLVPISAITIFIKSINLTLSNGILKCMNDASYVFWLEAFTQWLLIIPYLLLLTFIFRTPIQILFLSFFFEDLIKFIPLSLRLKNIFSIKHPQVSI
ncbi:MAG: MATE family efflux transporter, partial [Cellvibrionales bacterium]|nr:MATE family efflux transporter [Cellvibrionales bacterium]